MKTTIEIICEEQNDGFTLEKRDIVEAFNRYFKDKPFEVIELDVENLQNKFFNAGIRRAIEILKEYGQCDNNNLIKILESNIEATNKIKIKEMLNGDLLPNKIYLPDRVLLEEWLKNGLTVLKFGRMMNIDLELLHLDYDYDLIFEQICLRVTALIVACMKKKEAIETDKYEIPSTWWEHFKRDVMPEWFQNKFPVKYKTLIKQEEHRHYNVCPHRYWDDLKKHADFMEE